MKENRMKKLLNILGALGLMTTTSVSVMAMSPNIINTQDKLNDKKNIIIDLKQIDGKDFDFPNVHYATVWADYFFDQQIPVTIADMFGVHPLINYFNHSEIFNVTENRPYDAKKYIFIPEHGAGTYVFRTTYTSNADGTHMGFINSATITATLHYAKGDLSRISPYNDADTNPVATVTVAKERVHANLVQYFALLPLDQETSLYYIIGNYDLNLSASEWHYFDANNNELLATDVDNLTPGSAFTVRTISVPTKRAQGLGITGSFISNITFTKA